MGSLINDKLLHFVIEDCITRCNGNNLQPMSQHWFVFVCCFMHGWMIFIVFSDYTLKFQPVHLFDDFISTKGSELVPPWGRRVFFYFFLFRAVQLALWCGCPALCVADAFNHDSRLLHHPQLWQRRIRLYCLACALGRTQRCYVKVQHSETLNQCSPNSTCCVTSQHDMSRASWRACCAFRACRAVLSDERDTARHDFSCAKMHGLDSVSCRGVTQQVEFRLMTPRTLLRHRVIGNRSVSFRRSNAVASTSSTISTDTSETRPVDGWSEELYGPRTHAHAHVRPCRDKRPLLDASLYGGVLWDNIPTSVKRAPVRVADRQSVKPTAWPLPVSPTHN